MSALRHVCLMLAGMMLLFPASGCEDGAPSKPRATGWDTLSFDGGSAFELELAWPYLYVCASRSYGEGGGVYRCRLTTATPRWRYLGLADVYVNDIEILEGSILVASRTGIFRSDDGSAWVRSDTGIPCPDDGNCQVWALASCGTTVYAAAYSRGLYRSEDGGVSWDQIAYEEMNPHINVACHPRDPDFLLAIVYPQVSLMEQLRVSQNGGETWRSVTGRPFTFSRYPLSLAMDPTAAGVAYAGMSGSLVKTCDSGESWSVVLEPTDYSHFRAISHDQRTPGHVFVGGNRYPKGPNNEDVVVYEGWANADTLTLIEEPMTGQLSDVLYDYRLNTLFVTAGGEVFRHRR